MKWINRIKRRIRAERNDRRAELSKLYRNTMRSGKNRSRSFYIQSVLHGLCVLTQLCSLTVGHSFQPITSVECRARTSLHSLALLCFLLSLVAAVEMQRHSQHQDTLNQLLPLPSFYLPLKKLQMNNVCSSIVPLSLHSPSFVFC